MVMPALIVSLIAGLTVFYFYSDPERIAERAERQQARTVAGGSAPSSSIGEPGVPARPPTLETADPAGQSLPAARPVSSPAGALDSSAVGDRAFTPWLSPLALDNYIQLKSRAPEGETRSREFWISAIEGRWRDGAHQFRIRYDEVPDRGDWQSRYRVNLTPDGFLQAHAELRDQGFQLIHSQSFLHPDQQRRYQAVWESNRSVPEVASSEPAPEMPPAPSPSGEALPGSFRERVDGLRR